MQIVVRYDHNLRLCLNVQRTTHEDMTRSYIYTPVLLTITPWIYSHKSANSFNLFFYLGFKFS